MKTVGAHVERVNPGTTEWRREYVMKVGIKWKKRNLILSKNGLKVSQR